MGFFDIFKKKKEEDKLIIKSPITGKGSALSEVLDPVFSEKVLGDGVAVLPISSGNIVAPINGKIVQFFDTLHAFTIESENGVSVLFHFGLDTVKLNGEGFTKVLNEGDTVKVGDVIAKYDLEAIKDKVPSVLSPVIILDSENYKKISLNVVENVIEGETTLIEVEL